MIYLIFPLTLLIQSAQAVDKEFIHYINESLAQIPSLSEFEAGQRCQNQIIQSNQKISFNYYELLTMDTFRGPTASVKKYVLDRPYPLFDNTDEAALFFIDFIKENFDTTQVEYCTVFEKYGDQVKFRKFYRGTPSSCPTQGETFNDPVASIHTHPGEDRDSPDLSLPIQVPSYGDYAVAVDRNHTQYMAGPAGQVLKYTKDDIECRGQLPNLLIKLGFEQIRAPKSSSRNNYSIGESFQLLDNYGKSYLRWLCPHIK